MKKFTTLLAATVLGGCTATQSVMPTVKSVVPPSPPPAVIKVEKTERLEQYYRCREAADKKMLPLIKIAPHNGGESEIFDTYHRYVGDLIAFIKRNRRDCDIIVEGYIH